MKELQKGRFLQNHIALLTELKTPYEVSFSKQIFKKLGELKYGALPHPPYFLDLFFTIFDLFEHLDAFFKDILFKNQESVESDFSEFY
uniref:DUF2357 domain-containing protein n=1 Tax=Strongyloides papillosus TaxID=174720 RepID=A0A0N5B4S1_STREA